MSQRARDVLGFRMNCSLVSTDPESARRVADHIRALGGTYRILTTNIESAVDGDSLVILDWRKQAMLGETVLNVLVVRGLAESNAIVILPDNQISHLLKYRAQEAGASVATNEHELIALLHARLSSAVAA